MEDWGLFASGKVRLLNERLIFSAGLRHDKYTNTNANANGSLPSVDTDHTAGSLGVAYLPMTWLKLRANYAEGFKMPTPAQAGGNGTNYIANSSLKPETSQTWEFGADATWNYVNAGLTWFHSDWKNKIVGEGGKTGCPGGGACYQYMNMESMTLAGLEGALSVDIGKAFQQNYSLKPYVNFTYLGARRNNNPGTSVYSNAFNPDGSVNNTLLYVPKWMGSFGVDYVHPAYKIKSRINANYYGQRKEKDYDSLAYMQTYVPGDLNRGGRMVVNLSLEKELADLSGPNHKLTLRTEVNNLFNDVNEMYYSYPGAEFLCGLEVRPLTFFPALRDAPVLHQRSLAGQGGDRRGHEPPGIIGFPPTQFLGLTGDHSAGFFYAR